MICYTPSSRYLYIQIEYYLHVLGSKVLTRRVLVSTGCAGLLFVFSVQVCLVSVKLPTELVEC